MFPNAFTLLRKMEEKTVVEYKFLLIFRPDTLLIFQLWQIGVSNKE